MAPKLPCALKQKFAVEPVAVCPSEEVQLVVEADGFEFSVKTVQSGAQPLVWEEEIESEGRGFTFTATVAVAEGVPQPSVTVTVYVLLDTGEALTDEPVGGVVPEDQE